MEQRINELENYINGLKIRIFDMSEELTLSRKVGNEYRSTLNKIVGIVGLTPDENGNVSFEDIVKAVRDLVPQEDVAVEEEDDKI